MFTKEFWKAAIMRAIRTAAQTALATISTAVVLSDVKWLYCLSTVAVATIASLLTSIVMGIPEA